MSDVWNTFEKERHEDLRASGHQLQRQRFLQERFEHKEDERFDELRFELFGDQGRQNIGFVDPIVVEFIVGYILLEFVRIALSGPPVVSTSAECDHDATGGSSSGQFGNPFCLHGEHHGFFGDVDHDGRTGMLISWTC